MEKRIVEVEMQDVLANGEVEIMDTFELEGRAVSIKYSVLKASSANSAHVRVEVNGAPSGRKFKTSVSRKLSEHRSMGHTGNSNAGAIMSLTSNLVKGDKFRFETVYEISPITGLWGTAKLQTITY